jgi:hypothetical protein
MHDERPQHAHHVDHALQNFQAAGDMFEVETFGYWFNAVPDDGVELQKRRRCRIREAKRRCTSRFLLDIVYGV